MIDPNEVIEGLKELREYADSEIHQIVSPDNWSVYSRLRDLIDETDNKVLALLKAQEPRVIELSEITPHVYVWVEDRNEKTLFPLKGGMVDPDGDDYFRFVENVNADYVYWPTVTYRKWWRVWNLMPSPEQMRETKWDAD